MALQALHSFYWAGADPAVPVASVAGYGGWQIAAHALGLLLGALAGVPVLAVVAPVETPIAARTWRTRLAKWGWQRTSRLRQRIPDRWWLLLRIARLLASPDFDRARQAVRQVAVTPALRETHAYTAIGNWIAAHPGARENLCRQLLAADAYGATAPQTAHVRNALVELAYLALKDR